MLKWYWLTGFTVVQNHLHSVITYISMCPSLSVNILIILCVLPWSVNILIIMHVLPCVTELWCGVCPLLYYIMSEWVCLSCMVKCHNLCVSPLIKQSTISVRVFSCIANFHICVSSLPLKKLQTEILMQITFYVLKGIEEDQRNLNAYLPLIGVKK